MAVGGVFGVLLYSGAGGKGGECSAVWCESESARPKKMAKEDSQSKSPDTKTKTRKGEEMYERAMKEESNCRKDIFPEREWKEGRGRKGVGRRGKGGRMV